MNIENEVRMKRMDGFVIILIILDLPSLTWIRGSCSNAFDCMGRVIVESMHFDLRELFNQMFQK